MLITNYKKRSCLTKRTLEIKIGSNKISQTTNEKLLGVFINENLSWNTHINYLCEKLTKKLYLLKQLKVFMDIPTRVLFYNAYVFSSLMYCCCVWGLCPTNSIDRIFKFQKRCARAIFDKPFDHPHEELFSRLKWLEFHSYVRYRMSIMAYRSLHNLAPKYLTDLLEKRKPADYNFRQTPLFKIPSYTTSIYEYIYSVQAAKVLNEVTRNDVNIELKYSNFRDKAFNYFYYKENHTKN